MDMKWHPIVNGDLSGIPKYEHFLFTIDDELGVKSYVVCGEVRGIIEDLFVFGGGCCYEAEDVKAWMELPEPFTPNAPKREREQWFREFPEAIPLVKELQDKVKAEKPENHTPLRNHEWFL